MGLFNKFGTVIGTPTVIADGDEHTMRIFVRGTTDQVYLMNCVGTDSDFICDPWQTPTSFKGQQINGSPIAFRTLTTRYLFARNSNGALIVSVHGGGSIWSGWLPLGGFYR